MHLEPPFLHAHAEFESTKQMMNQLKVLTSGVEHKGTVPFYASEKWRFVERVQWWDEYADSIPVVIGRYWRRLKDIERSTVGKGSVGLFENTSPLAWHRKHHNACCEAFSAGGRWTGRRAGIVLGQDFKLAALRWPERIVLFDYGRQEMTR